MQGELKNTRKFRHYLYSTRHSLREESWVGLAEGLSLVQDGLESLLAAVNVGNVVSEVTPLLDLLPTHGALERLHPEVDVADMLLYGRLGGKLRLAHHAGKHFGGTLHVVTEDVAHLLNENEQKNINALFTQILYFE